MNRKKWVVSDCDKDVAAGLAESCGVDPFAAYLLCARGMTDDFEVESFLYDTDLLDPYTLPDMEKAVERINEAIENGERITVFGDYDADGVTSTALLYSYLCSKGANVDYYIPDREGEGYGMSVEAIDVLKSRETSLIITVDNGISAIEEISHAKSIGIDVVVTDHHRAGETLPDAVAVVDPHREDSFCEFSDWAGVGVAFKLVCALENGEDYDVLEKYGDLVTVGTIADIVSLKGENRVIVRSGIAMMNASLNDGSMRKGLAALFEMSGNVASVDSASVAYRIAPRINAAGRMGSAERALKLLLTDDAMEAKEIAEDISQANTQRQATETKISETAIELIESRPDIKYSRVIVVEGEGWHQGVIGIVASRLTEKYGKPCIVISKNGDIAKGSGRSIDGFCLYDALSYCSDILVQYGGHVLAAGLTVESDKIDLFREKINEYALRSEPAVPVLNIDCKINPVSINTDLLNSISILEPFGAENPQPVFGLYNMELSGIQPVGAGKHLRLNLRRKNASISVILFSVTQDEFSFVVGDMVDVAVKLGVNEYQGKTQVSIQAKAIKLSNVPDCDVCESMRAYEDFYLGASLSDDDKTSLHIDRDFCGNVYRFVKSNNGWNHSAEMLCYRLGLSAEKTGACQIALDVFSELGILVYNEGKYIIPEVSIKSALENSDIFKRASE